MNEITDMKTQCLANQKALVSKLTAYLNANISNIGDNMVCDDVCGTIYTVADNLKALADIYIAAKQIEENGELGQLTFEKMIWKDGKRQHDGSNA